MSPKQAGSGEAALPSSQSCGPVRFPGPPDPPLLILSLETGIVPPCLPAWVAADLQELERMPEPKPRTLLLLSPNLATVHGT